MWRASYIRRNASWPSSVDLLTYGLVTLPVPGHTRNALAMRIFGILVMICLKQEHWISKAHGFFLQADQNYWEQERSTRSWWIFHQNIQSSVFSWWHPLNRAATYGYLMLPPKQIKTNLSPGACWKNMFQATSRWGPPPSYKLVCNPM